MTDLKVTVKRKLAFILAVCIMSTSFHGDALAEVHDEIQTDETEVALFSLDSGRLKEEAEFAIQEGMESNIPFDSEELDLSSGECKKIFQQKNGYIYEVNTDSVYTSCDEMTTGAGLRIFVRASNSNAQWEIQSASSCDAQPDTPFASSSNAQYNGKTASASDADSEYMGEEIIFLFMNNTETELQFQLNLDEKLIYTEVIPDYAADAFVIKLTEEERYPEFEAAEKIGDVTVRVKAESGKVPPGTMLKVEEVTESLKEAVVDTAKSGSSCRVTDALTYDIDLVYQGEALAWEEGTIEVTIMGDPIKNNYQYANSVQIFHVEQEEKDSVTINSIKEEKVSDQEGRTAVSFEAEHFSVYSIVFLSSNALNAAFDPNGGEGSAYTIAVFPDQEGKYQITLPYSNRKGHVFTKKGHRFIGWSTNKNGDSTTNKNLIDPDANLVPPHQYEITKNTTYYAIWLADTGSDLLEARFFIRKDKSGGYRNEPYSYPAKDYFPAHPGLEGKIRKPIAINNNIENVSANIDQAPSDASIMKAARQNGFRYNPKTEKVLWYVIKREGNAWHVDGVIQDIEKYQVIYNTNGGDTLAPATKQYGKDETVRVTFETIPNRSGYLFAGWDTDRYSAEPDYWKGAENNQFSMPDHDVILYAIWKPKGDVPYTVKYYYEKNGTYSGEEDRCEIRNGTVGHLVSLTDQDFISEKKGYDLDDGAVEKRYEGVISGDGSLVLKVYFKQIRSLTLKKTVTGLPDSNVMFEFTVDFTDGKDLIKADRPVLATVFEDGRVIYKLQLKSGESVTFSGIPGNVDYQITEEVFAHEYYESHCTGIITREGEREEKQEIPDQQNVKGSMAGKVNLQVEFINQLRYKTSDITIHKNLTRKDQEDAVFVFEIQNKDKNSPGYGQKFYSAVMIKAGETGNSTVISDVVMSNHYIVSEMDHMRYEVKSVEPEGELNTLEAQTKITFINQKKSSNYFSDSAIICNKVIQEQDGSSQFRVDDRAHKNKVNYQGMPKMLLPEVKTDPFGERGGKYGKDSD